MAALKTSDGDACITALSALKPYIQNLEKVFQELSNNAQHFGHQTPALAGQLLGHVSRRHDQAMQLVDSVCAGYRGATKKLDDSRQQEESVRRSLDRQQEQLDREKQEVEHEKDGLSKARAETETQNREVNATLDRLSSLTSRLERIAPTSESLEDVCRSLSKVQINLEDGHNQLLKESRFLEGKQRELLESREQQDRLAQAQVDEAIHSTEKGLNNHIERLDRYGKCFLRAQQDYVSAGIRIVSRTASLEHELSQAKASNAKAKIREDAALSMDELPRILSRKISGLFKDGATFDQDIHSSISRGFDSLRSDVTTTLSDTLETKAAALKTDLIGHLQESFVPSPHVTKFVDNACQALVKSATNELTRPFAPDGNIESTITRTVQELQQDSLSTTELTSTISSACKQELKPFRADLSREVAEACRKGMSPLTHQVADIIAKVCSRELKPLDKALKEAIIESWKSESGAFKEALGSAVATSCQDELRESQSTLQGALTQAIATACQKELPSLGGALSKTVATACEKQVQPLDGTIRKIMDDSFQCLSEDLCNSVDTSLSTQLANQPDPLAGVAERMSEVCAGALSSVESKLQQVVKNEINDSLDQHAGLNSLLSADSKYVGISSQCDKIGLGVVELLDSIETLANSLKDVRITEELKKFITDSLAVTLASAASMHSKRAAPQSLLSPHPAKRTRLSNQTPELAATQHSDPESRQLEADAAPRSEARLENARPEASQDSDITPEQVSSRQARNDLGAASEDAASRTVQSTDTAPGTTSTRLQGSMATASAPTSTDPDAAKAQAERASKFLTRFDRTSISDSHWSELKELAVRFFANGQQEQPDMSNWRSQCVRQKALRTGRDKKKRQWCKACRQESCLIVGELQGGLFTVT